MGLLNISKLMKENNKEKNANEKATIVETKFSRIRLTVGVFIAMIIFVIDIVVGYKSEYEKQISLNLSDLLISLHAVAERTETIHNLDNLYQYYDEEYSKIYGKIIKTYMDISEFNEDSLKVLQQVDTEANLYIEKNPDNGYYISTEGKSLILNKEEQESVKKNSLQKGGKYYDTVFCQEGIVLVEWDNIDPKVTVGRNIIDICQGSAFLYNMDKGEIAYADDEEIIGNYSEFHIEEINQEVPNHSEDVKIGKVYLSPNNKYLGYGVCKNIDNESILCTYVSEDKIKQEVLDRILYPFIMKIIFVIYFIICLCIFLEYSEMIKEKNNFIKVGKGKYISKSFVTKIMSVLIIAILLFSVFTYYVNTLVDYSRQNMLATEDLEFLERSIEKNEDDRDNVRKNFENEFESIARGVALLVKSDSLLRGNLTLDDLKSDFKLDAISVYDVNGKIVNTTTDYKGYTISQDSSTPEYVLWNILTSGSISEFYESGDGQVVYNSAVRRVDSPGMVKIEASIFRIDSVLNAINFENVVIDSDFNSTAKAYVLLDNADELEWIYSDSDKVIRMDNPFKDTMAMNNGYAGVHKLNGNTYYINVLRSEDYAIISAEDVSLQRINSIKYVFYDALLVLLIMIIILGFSIVLNGTEQTDNNEEQDKSEELNASYLVLKKMQSLLKKSLNILLGICIFCQLAFLVGTHLAGTNSFLMYLFVGTWEKGINIFSITVIVLTIFFAMILTILERKIIILVSDSLGTQSATAGHLISSMLSVGIALGAVLYSLVQLGIDTTTILASLGIGSIVLGMAAKDVIADMLAGIFIVAEGHICVGEWITVDSFHGEVSDIGIRTTKIKDYGGKILSIPNSEMRQVINYSRSLSYIGVDVYVKPDVNLDKIIKIIEDNEKLFYKENEFIRSKPEYQQIANISKDGIAIRIATMTEERFVPGCTRIFNETIFKLLSKEGVLVEGVPIKIVTGKDN